MRLLRFRPYVHFEGLSSRAMRGSFRVCFLASDAPLCDPLVRRVGPIATMLICARVRLAQSLGENGRRCLLPSVLLAAIFLAFGSVDVVDG